MVIYIWRKNNETQKFSFPLLNEFCNREKKSSDLIKHTHRLGTQERS